MVRNLPDNARDIRNVSLISGQDDPPRGGHVSPLQYSYLENPMVGGAWPATVHRVEKSWTPLKRLSMQGHPCCIISFFFFF